MEKRLDYLTLAYPNFTLGSIINPDEANQNNFDIANSINDIVDETKYIIDALSAPTGASEIGASVSGLNGASVQQLLIALKQHIDAHRANTSNPHGVTASQLNTYTKTELDPYLRGGDTLVKYEVFTIVNDNNGNGTFTYRNKTGTNIVGNLTAQGYQVFTLEQGKYNLGENRISAVINDTLQRSVASGGLSEIDSTHVALTSPEGSGAEITIMYFERVGIVGAGFVQTTPVQPVSGSMWFKVVG